MICGHGLEASQNKLATKKLAFIEQQKMNMGMQEASARGKSYL